MRVHTFWTGSRTRVEGPFWLPDKGSVIRLWSSLVHPAGNLVYRIPGERILSILHPFPMGRWSSLVCRPRGRSLPQSGTAVESGPAEAAFRRMSAVSLAPEGDPLMLMSIVSPLICLPQPFLPFPQRWTIMTIRSQISSRTSSQLAVQLARPHHMMYQCALALPPLPCIPSPVP